MSEKKLFVVGRAADIPPGETRIVDIEGRSVGVFNVDGEFFAIRNTCPHASGPLCLGIRSGMVVSSEPGRYDYIRRGEFIRCPWHQWEFDIRTGRSWFDPDRTRVRRYEVRVRGGADLLDGEVLGQDADLVEAGLLPGPYVAETYPVSRDGDYVVVEL